MTSEDSPIACAVAAAAGRAQARVVCGDRKVDVETLLPYATRGLPMQAMGTSDLHVDIMLSPIRERYEAKLRQAKALGVPLALHALGITDSRLSRPITEILYALGDEIVDVVDDLDRISLDSRLEKSPDRVDIWTTLDFGRAHSWTAQALADTGKRSAPPAPSFFELPRDSSLASYVGPQNPKLYENILHRLNSLIDGSLGHINVGQKVRDQFSREVESLYSTRTSSGACGAVPAEGEIDVKSEKKDLLGTFSPWQVCIYDQALPPSMTGTFDALIKIVADPSFRKAVDAKTLAFKRTPAGAGMPQGTVAYELSVDSSALVKSLGEVASGKPSTKSKAKATPDKPNIQKIYFYVAPDANRWLFGMGRDSKELQAHLLAIKKATPENRIGAIPEMAYLKSAPGVAGGFFTLSYFAKLFSKAAQSAHLKEQPGVDPFSTAPHHGTTPIPLVWTVSGEPTAPKLECKFRVERAVFEDAFALGTNYAARLVK